MLVLGLLGSHRSLWVGGAHAEEGAPIASHCPAVDAPPPFQAPTEGPIRRTGLVPARRRSRAHPAAAFAINTAGGRPFAPLAGSVRTTANKNLPTYRPISSISAAGVRTFISNRGRVVFQAVQGPASGLLPPTHRSGAGRLGRSGLPRLG